MTELLLAAGLLLAVPALLVRLWFLAPTRVGWIFYYANVFEETFVKRLRASHGTAGALLFAVGLAFLVAGGQLAAAIAITAALAVLDLSARAHERRLLTTIHAHPYRMPLPYRAFRGGRLHGYPQPCAQPEPTLNLVGPFVRRTPVYDLGRLVVGRSVVLELRVANHTVLPMQGPLSVEVRTGAGVEAHTDLPADPSPPGPGEIFVVRVVLGVRAAGPAGEVVLDLVLGDRTRTIRIRHSDRVDASVAVPASASISRYPGASRAAFAWRGDMDLYDRSSFQSIAGLDACFSLAARYCFPQTMYLSSRLTLDLDETRSFHEHFGSSRGQEEIPTFIEWMRQNVELRHRLPYPVRSPKRFAIEMGNHGHLHFGTDAAPAEGNAWTFKAKLMAGRYPWVGEDTSSFGEQRDNAIRMRSLAEEHFGFSPRSWAMPDRTRDEFTAAAMEAAGCDVLSDSDVRTADNVVFQPPPHRPAGSKAVELTKRYPGDPEHVFHVGMIEYWMFRAHRRRIPVVFMCHQHMRQFDGTACTRFTEHILRSALTRFSGDLYIDTVFGIGRYWGEVLDPSEGKVRVTVESDRVFVTNGSVDDFERVPVDIGFRDGGRATYLVDLPAGGRVEVPISGG